VVGRRRGSLLSSASSTGPSGPARRGSPGGSCRIAARVAAGPPRSNGGAPSTANHRVAPSPHRSAGGPPRRPIACSGATYGSDPKAAPVSVRWVSSSKAMPKSASLAGAPAGVITFAGLTS